MAGSVSWPMLTPAECIAAGARPALKECKAAIKYSEYLIAFASFDLVLWRRISPSNR